MKKLLSMVLALTLLMSSLTAFAAVVNPVPYPETGVVFSDDFEDYKVSGGNGANVQVTAGHALRTNWNYNNNCWVINTAEDNTAVYWGDVWYQLPSGATGVSSGVLEYSFDLRMHSTGITKGDFYMAIWKTTADKSFFPVTANVDSSDMTKMNIYFGTGDNRGARPSSETDHTLVTTTTDVWHNIKVRVDFENKTIDYYLDGNLAASHSGNDTNSAPTSECTLTGYVGLCQTEATYTYVDNVKFEKMQSFVDPESVGSYTVNGSVPETGIIAKDNFDNYENSDWTGGKLRSISNPDNVWHYTPGDILPSGSDGNKYLNMRWTSNTAYYLTDHNLPGAVINTGKLKIEYKVNVRQMNVSDNTLANPENGDRQVLYVANWGPNGKMYLNTVVYSPEKPFMAFSKTLNNHSAANETDTDAPTVKKTFDFETWNTVTMIIDYENGTVCQYFNGEFVTSFAVNPTNANIEFYEFDLCRSHSKNGQEISGAADVYYPNGERVDIRIDDVRIERLVPVSYDEPLTTKIKKNGADITVADVAGGDVLTVDFETPSTSTGNVVIAAYKGEQLQGVVSSINTLISKGSNSIALTADDKFEGADTIKAFIFSNFDNMYPMADAAVYTK